MRVGEERRGGSEGGRGEEHVVALTQSYVWMGCGSPLVEKGCGLQQAPPLPLAAC